MKIPLVDLKRQHLPLEKALIELFQEAIHQSTFIMGEGVASFEASFAAFCNAEYCIGVGNGTDALVLALQAQGIGPGDEVITVPNTFIATSEAITKVGARPVFVDIERGTFNINVRLIEKVISKKSRAIVPVHLYGQPADMNPIMDIADKYGLKVLEDAAQAHGAVYNGRRVGSIGHAAAFSFYPGKNLGCLGDGGAVVTNDSDLAEMVAMLRNHGRKEKYVHAIEGVNSRLDTIQALFLNKKLEMLDKWNRERRDIARLYNEMLSHVKGIVSPLNKADRDHVYHLYVIRAEERDALMNYLKEGGISTGVHYPLPLHLQPAYQWMGYRNGDFPETEKAASEILSLPLFPGMKKEEIEYVVEKIEQFYKK